MQFLILGEDINKHGNDNIYEPMGVIDDYMLCPNRHWCQKAICVKNATDEFC